MFSVQASTADLLFHFNFKAKSGSLTLSSGVMRSVRLPVNEARGYYTLEEGQDERRLAARHIR